MIIRLGKTMKQSLSSVCFSLIRETKTYIKQ